MNRQQPTQSHLEPGCTCTHKPGWPCEPSCQVHGNEPGPFKVEVFYDRERGSWIVSMGADGYRDVFVSEDEDEAQGVYVYVSQTNAQTQEAIWLRAGHSAIIYEEYQD